MTQRCTVGLNGSFQLNAVKFIGIDYDEIGPIHDHKGQKRQCRFRILYNTYYIRYINYIYDTYICTDHINNAQFDKKRTYQWLSTKL